MKLLMFTLFVFYIPNIFAKIDVPADTQEYIYGLGVDVDHGSAQKFALADITQKLATRVQSSVGITQNKNDQYTSTNTKQITTAKTQEIALPNVMILKNVQQQGRWWILIRVERKLVQRSIKAQINDLSDAISLLLEDFSTTQGPACWFLLTENKVKRQQLADLIPAYIGSGINEIAVVEYKKQLSNYDRLYKRCQYKNKYITKYSSTVSNEFKISFEQFMKNQGYKITKQHENVGTLAIQFSEKYFYAYKNHLSVINGQLNIFDEFGEMKKHISFKSKGSSFNNKQDAKQKAIHNLTKKLAELVI